MNKIKKYEQLINKIWFLNRVHVSSEMSLAYKIVNKFYKNSKIISFKTGNESLGWVVPKGWDVIHAKLYDSKGNVIADWKKNKLILWTYSISFKGHVTKTELLKRIFTDKNRPKETLFCFRNQYNSWKKEWGFSLPYNKVKKFSNKDKFKVDIKTKFFNHKMEMLEHSHKGKLDHTLLFIGHFDHPQMLLDGLSGCIAGHEAISRIKNIKTKLSYKMLSTVEIIGSVFYTKKSKNIKNVKQGLFVASSGAKESFKYQKTFDGNNPIDRVLCHIIKYIDDNSKIYNFREGPLGNDEIAYDVGGINIPCGSIMRAPFEVYHTDRDTPKANSKSKFEETVELLLEVVHIFENNKIIRRNFSGLPRLSSKKIDLYLEPSQISGVNSSKDLDERLIKGLNKKNIKYLHKNTHKFNKLMNSIPSMAEGKHTILDIANFSDLPFRFVENYINLWVKKKLLKTKWQNPFN